MAGKHAPIALGKYVEIHEAAMGSLRREGHVMPDGDGLTIQPVARGLLMSGPIRCAGGIVVQVTKQLAVVAGEDDTAVVQTVAYTYHVMVEGLGNLFRYCGPHDDAAHPDHKPFHHKHIYDLLRGDVEGKVAEVDPEERPTLAEVIREACDWYFANAHEVESVRAR